MRQMPRVVVGWLLFCLSLTICSSAQKAHPGLLGAEELKRLVPSAYFFDGQSAPVEVRNSAAFRTPGDKMVLAGLVDTSGYAADLQQKYQGFFITEIKLSVGGSDLGPGAYGFGFTKDGKFLVMDVAAMELLSVATSSDDKLAHPVPLKMMEDSGGGYRLYHGKSFVVLKAQ
jgi:hypothetical protein